MKNRVSGVNQKHYTQYNFQDHIWNMSTPANKYMLELAERCVKIDGMYHLKKPSGHWAVFSNEKDAMREAGNMWIGSTLCGSYMITTEVIKLFFSGMRDNWIGKTKTVEFVGSCPNLDHSMVIPLGPNFITYDNKTFLNTWHDDMIEGDIRNLRSGKAVLLMIYRSLCNGDELHPDNATEADILYNQVLTNNYTNLDFKFCIYWLAKIVQAPGCNLQTNLWFCGAQEGVGKGTLVNIMRNIIGHRAVGDLNQTEIEAGWNDHIVGKMLMSSNEFDTTGKMNGKAWNKWIKNTCNDEIVSIRQRNMSSKTVLNISNWIFTSNDENPLYLDKTDRRNHLIKTTDDPQWKEFAAHIKVNYVDKDPKSIAEGFAYILEQVMVDDVFVNTSFINNLKASIIADSQNMVEEWISLDSLIVKDARVLSSKLYEDFKLWMHANMPKTPLPSLKEFGVMMSKAGSSGVEKHKTKHGTQYSIGVPVAAIKINPKDIAKNISSITGKKFSVQDNDVLIKKAVAPVLSDIEKIREQLRRQDSESA
jgi:hypothetical protein